MTMHFWSSASVPFIVSLIVALLCGTAIGIERQWRGRQAGLRTNLLVCVGSTIFTYLSATAFGTSTDKSRVAAQIVSGIGFLGAGVVLGLNTAATVWAAAAVGMAAGIGSYDIALIATLGLLAVQLLFRPLAGMVDRRALRDAPRFRYWLTVAVDTPAVTEVQDIISSTLTDYAIDRLSVHLHATDAGDVTMEFVLVSPSQEVPVLESLFADPMRLSALRDLQWRSEIETPGSRWLRRRIVTRRGNVSSGVS